MTMLEAVVVGFMGAVMSTLLYLARTAYHTQYLVNSRTDRLDKRIEVLHNQVAALIGERGEQVGLIDSLKDEIVTLKRESSS